MLNIISSKVYHIFLSLLLFLIFMVFILLSLIFLFSQCSFFLDLSFFSWSIFSWSICLMLNSISCRFSCVVSLIRRVVLIYTYYYIGSSFLNWKTFNILTLRFVGSILLVILFDDLFVIILGWDGLGVISFFLIVFYQNNLSIYSGLLTIHINRVGDGLLVATISLFIISIGFTSPLGFLLVDRDVSLLIISLLIISLITKRAIFPFSPWLPAAIAAPTPISSLVHSSTLVTAGLYLIIRFSCFIYQLESISFSLHVLFWLGLFTSLYAGLCSLFEPDLKKLVALSTLSHLGFICLAFSLGRVDLSFFHLLSHALFKSLLFMGLGNVLSGRSHMQDSRFLSSGLILLPVSSSLILVSIMNLLGLPFIRGFYSKDLVLEFTMFRPVASNLSVLILYLNVLFTFSYTFRILLNLSSQIKISHSFFSSVLRDSSLHFNYLSFLSFLSISFITFWIWLYSPVSIRAVPIYLKLSPFSLLLFFLISTYFYLSLNIGGDIPTIFSRGLISFSNNISLFVSSIVGLLFLWSSLVRLLFSTFLMSSWKTIESGFIPSVIFMYPSQESICLRSRISQFYLTPVISTFFILISFLFLGCLLVLVWGGS